MARGRSSGPTCSPTEACHEGEFRALPQPIRKVNSSRIGGLIMPRKVRAARAAEKTNIIPWRRQHDQAPVVDVGYGAGDQGEGQHGHRAGRRLDQGHGVRPRSTARSISQAAPTLDQPAEVRDQVGGPDAGEEGLTQRAPSGRTSRRQRWGFTAHARAQGGRFAPPCATLRRAAAGAAFQAQVSGGGSRAS